MRHLRHRAVILAASLLLVAGCGTTGHAPSMPGQLVGMTLDRQNTELGSLQVSIQTTYQGDRKLMAIVSGADRQTAWTVSDVTTYRLTVVGADGVPIVQTCSAPAGSNGKVSTLFDDLAPGSYSVTIEALSADGEVLGSDTQTATVSKGKCTTINLHVKLKPVYVDNHNGRIQVLVDVENGDLIENPIDTCAPVDGYTPLTPCTPTPTPGGSGGGSVPVVESIPLQVTALATDRQTGMIWGTHPGGVLRFDPADGHVIEDHPLGNTTGMAASPEGGIWYRSFDTNQYYRISADGQTTTGPYNLAPTFHAGNGGNIACDSAGNLWIAMPDQNLLVKASPSGEVLGSYAMPAWPGCVVTGDNGEVYVSCHDAGVIVRVGQDGSVQQTISVGAAPGGIAVDHHGNIWSSLDSQRAVYKFAPDGQRLATITGFSGYPGGFMIDSNNTAWTMTASAWWDFGSTAQLHSIGENDTTATPRGLGAFGMAEDRTHHIWLGEDTAWAIRYTP